MTAFEYQAPVFRVRCDTPGCPAWYESVSAYDSRFAHNTAQRAGEAGWDAPPARGKGSRRNKHYCPDCVQDRSQERGGQR